MKIASENWKWLGHAGHFIGSRECRFHLNTQVGNWLISTVGEWHPNPDKPKVPIGSFDMFYETMVFRLGRKACHCGCGARDPVNWIEEDGTRYKTAAEATEGHLRMCNRYAEIG